MNTRDLLLHPVRLRIVHAMSGGRTRTTADLCARLPDVSKATVYRQVALLAEGGLLEVVGEQRVHGAVERSYQLHQARAVIDRDAAASMSLEEHRQGFAAAVAGLVAEFNAYLDREHADPTADLVGYRQIPLWLTHNEVAELIGKVHSLIMSSVNNEPAPDRRMYLLSPILFPIEEPPQSTTDEQPDHPVGRAKGSAVRAEGSGAAVEAPLAGRIGDRQRKWNEHQRSQGECTENDG